MYTFERFYGLSFVKYLLFELQLAKYKPLKLSG